MSHIEQLEIEMDLKANAIGAPQKLDHQNDFLDHGNAGPRRGRNEGGQLW